MSPTVSGQIERILDGEICTQFAADENSWHDLWHNKALGELDPVASAVVGGALSDRLSWVFVSGYQAALRKVFPRLPSEGWAAFAATEAKDDPDYPGTVLTGHDAANQLALSGNKSWVAQSCKVRHLLVTARSSDTPEGPPAECVWVDAESRGVSLSHRDSPAFLGEMSQGFAAFDNVLVESDRVLPRLSARSFGRTEPRFVMLSACGLMLAHAVAAENAKALRTQLVATTLALAECSHEEQMPPQLMAELDDSFARCAETFAATGISARVVSWVADNRLLRMYSRGVQNRAEKSRAKRERH